MRGSGELERLIMDAIWDEGPLLVREIVEVIAAVSSRPAYTTVQTVADRLVTKAMLSRTSDGKAFRYAATRPREEYVAALMLDALVDVDDRAPVFARFADAMTAADARKLLDALERRRGRRRS